MNKSTDIDKLAAALAVAQGKITGALKDSSNPFFESRYADLASCWDACREALSENGLSIVQTVKTGAPVKIEWETTDKKTAEVTQYHVDTTETVVVTTLLHASGQWIESDLAMIPRDASPQGVGSAITYGRRYGLTAMVGIAQVDDDGNTASGRVNGATTAKGHDPRGNVGKDIPVDTARTHALAMMAIIAAPAKDGDHDELQKALTALDYHTKHLAGNNDLYIAAADQMEAPKRNIWKTLVNKAKVAESADRAITNAGARRF